MSVTKQRLSTGQVLLPASNIAARDATKPLLLHGDVGSWTFGRGTVVWTIWPAVLLHTIFAAVVTSVSLTTKLQLAVPPVLITVLGVVIGFVIAYRASSGYDRYWTGRCSWGDVIKVSRTIGRLIWIHVPLRATKDGSPDDILQVESLMREKHLALDLVEGFSVALKHHLRGEAGIHYEDLYHLVKPLHRNSRSEEQHLMRTTQLEYRNETNPSSSVSQRHEPTWAPDTMIPAINTYGTFGRSSTSLCSSLDDSRRTFLFPSASPRKKKTFWGMSPDTTQTNLNNYKDVSGRRERHCESSGHKFRPKVAGGGGNVPLEILRCMSDWLAVLDERGVISGGPLGGMYSCITSLEDSLSALERILTTPIPFVYSAHIRQCVWFYLFLLPFQLVGQFRWYTIPGVGVAAFFYIGFLAAGEEIEQPFGYDDNDLDLDFFCDIIHADIEALKKMRNSDVLLSPSSDAATKVERLSPSSIAAFAGNSKLL